ncbi:PLP-dependent aminotransferase family protein [Candidatus Zixiibacteriota bacterium]
MELGMEKIETTLQKRTFTFDKSYFSPAAYALESSVIRDILKYSSKPGVISFSAGMPAPESFPIEELKAVADRVLVQYGTLALQYGLSRGYGPLREFVAEWVSRRGGDGITIDNIIITAGSQQGLDIVGRTFLQPGRYVLCARPTYLGALQAFNYYQAKYAPVEIDDDGMIVEDLEDKIKKYDPAFIYVVPNFQNPGGVTLSEERRHKLIDLAYKYKRPIIDDNPYGELRYSGTDQISLKRLGGDIVIQLGTFSKIISPGLRIGWTVAAKEVTDVFERVKQSTDLHTNQFAQYVVHEYVIGGVLERHIEMLIINYREQRDAMLGAMAEFFPDNVRWTKPEGGLFLWVILPEGVKGKEVFFKAIEEKVAFVPGKPFDPLGTMENTMRLNFSNATCENIREGIKRLGRVFTDL